MKPLLKILLLLVVLNIHAQSPTKFWWCNFSGFYTKPKSTPDCVGWMEKQHIDQKPCLPNQPWRLVFEDEFNSSQLDRTKWKSYTQCAGDVYNQEANLAFTGSTMKMQFKQENIIGYCTNDNTCQNFNYISGGIQTHIKALETGSVQIQHVYNLQDVPAGMYFVQFTSQNRKITKKLIKL